MLHVFEAINTQEYRKMPRLYFRNNNFIIQINKLHESQNHIITGNINLEELLPKLEKVANNNGFAYLQLSLRDDVFDNVHIDTLIRCHNTNG